MTYLTAVLGFSFFGLIAYVLKDSLYMVAVGQTFSLDGKKDYGITFYFTSETYSKAPPLSPDLAEKLFKPDRPLFNRLFCKQNFTEKYTSRFFEIREQYGQYGCRPDIKFNKTIYQFVWDYQQNTILLIVCFLLILIFLIILTRILSGCGLNEKVGSAPTNEKTINYYRVKRAELALEKKQKIIDMANLAAEKKEGKIIGNPMDVISMINFADEKKDSVNSINTDAEQLMNLLNTLTQKTGFGMIKKAVDSTQSIDFVQIADMVTAFAETINPDFLAGGTLATAVSLVKNALHNADLTERIILPIGNRAFVVTGAELQKALLYLESKLETRMNLREIFTEIIYEGTNFEKKKDFGLEKVLLKDSDLEKGVEQIESFMGVPVSCEAPRLDETPSLYNPLHPEIIKNLTRKQKIDMLCSLDVKGFKITLDDIMELLIHNMDGEVIFHTQRLLYCGVPKEDIARDILRLARGNWKILVDFRKFDVSQAVD